jgi:undecaprenyl pyrophosphate phosphatase UppP
MECRRRERVAMTKALIWLAVGVLGLIVVGMVVVTLIKALLHVVGYLIVGAIVVGAAMLLYRRGRSALQRRRDAGQLR